MKLLVVAGHGKKSSGVMDNGAGGSGYNEAERVRTLANRMKALAPDSVVLGDQSKKWIDYGLYNTVNKSTFDCAIELHMDSSSSASAKGGHVIIKSGYSADKYDKALESFIKGYFPGRSSTLVGRSDLGAVNSCANRGINFRLLETCFISNTSDIAKFNSNVDAVAKGILAAFGIGISSGSTTATTAPADPDGNIKSGGVSQTTKDQTGKVLLSTHMRDIGWGAWVADGNLAGSTGQNRRIEAIKIKPVKQMDVTVHIKDISDKKYSNITNSTVIGTVGEKKRLEAIMIESSDTIYTYRVHQKDIGWSAWVTNGQWAGTKGKSKQIEAIELKVAGVVYQAHVQSTGWSAWVADGETAGTTNQSKRVEAIRINPLGMEIEASAHMQDDGWKDYGKITKDTIIGTTGKSARLECLRLKGNIEYRVHIQGTGWTAWTKADGVATMGTIGQSLRVEAIEIRKK